VVPQLSAHTNYEEYIKSFESFLRIIPQIDAINHKRLTGDITTEPQERLSEFIQRRILKNQKRHAARASRPPKTNDVTTPQKAVSKPEQIAANMAEKQAIKAVQHELVAPIVENTKMVKEAITKLETLRTQPIQILHVKTPESRTTIKEDKSTGFRSTTNVTKPVLMAAIPSTPKQCAWCGETERQYLPPCTRHPCGHKWNETKPVLMAAIPSTTKQCAWCGETERQYLPPCAKHPNGTHSWR